MTINVGRIWSFCQNGSAEECEVAKARIVSGITKIGQPARCENVRLMVRDQGYLDDVRSAATPDKPFAAAFRQVGDDLYAILTVDSPEMTALANPATLTKLGPTAEKAWDMADRQPRAKLPMLPEFKTLLKKPAAFADGERLGRLLTQRNTFEKIAALVGPDLFVHVVFDGFVFVAALPDGPALEDFAATVSKDCAEQERCIPPHIYRFRNGQCRIANKGA